MSTAHMEFSFGNNDEAVGRKSKGFKAESGRSYRVSFCFWPGLEQGQFDMSKAPRFIGAKRHYLKDVGYFINKGPEYTKIAGGEAPKLRVGTVIIVWPYTKGAVDGEAVARGEFDVLPWVFDEKKYAQLKEIHNEWPFGQHDLKITCETGPDAVQFQKLSFVSFRDSVLYTLAQKGKSPIMTQIYERANDVASGLADMIGRDLSLDEIREKLKAAGSAAGGGGNAGAMSAAGDATVTEEVDNILSSILDS